jgi:predicted lysophospholipase L1 biosynthesis ABC-type transport system permease subunit
MGIRMAVGAQRGGVLKLVVAHGMRLAIAGIVPGAAGALALTRVLQGQLYAVRPTDPATFTAVATILATVAYAATLLPALRATRVDPVSRFARSDSPRNREEWRMHAWGAAPLRPERSSTCRTGRLPLLLTAESFCRTSSSRREPLR